MIAEGLVRTGTRLIADYPPNGKDYWAARFWDRDLAERDPVLGAHYQKQKEALGDLIERFGADTDTILEFACGTGEFTLIAADRTPARQITALDISGQGLERTRRRVDHPGLRLVQGDFWSDHDLKPAPLVICVDAIHHLGDVRKALRRLNEFVAPGGVVIGNLWTIDHFHELQRERYGAVLHAMRSALFFASAAMIRLSRGRLSSASYRTQLVAAKDVPRLLEETFDKVHDIVPDRFFVGFACGTGE